MKSRLLLHTISLCLLAFFCVDTAFAQSWSDRVDAVKRKRAQAKAQEITPDHPAIKMQQIIPAVDFDQTTLKHAIEWWRDTVGVAMLIDWNALELEGVDASMPISLKLRNAPASIVLELILGMASQEFKIYHYETKWYVQILTREQMLKKTEVRMYDVRDLLVQIPNYRNRVPKMGLGEVLSSTSTVGGGSGSGGGGSSVSLFDDGGSKSDDTKRPTQSEQAQQLIDLIRTTIEPEIWIANGGQYSSITFFNGMLVIRAPEFVHRQIGSPNASLLSSYRTVNEMGPSSSSGYQPGKAAATSSSSASTPIATGKSKVSAVQSKEAVRNVSGVSAAD